MPAGRYSDLTLCVVFFFFSMASVLCSTIVTQSLPFFLWLRADQALRLFFGMVRHCGRKLARSVHEVKTLSRYCPPPPLSGPPRSGPSAHSPSQGRKRSPHVWEFRPFPFPSPTSFTTLFGSVWGQAKKDLLSRPFFPWPMSCFWPPLPGPLSFPHFVGALKPWVQLFVFQMPAFGPSRNPDPRSDPQIFSAHATSCPPLDLFACFSLGAVVASPEAPPRLFSLCPYPPRQFSQSVGPHLYARFGRPHQPVTFSVEDRRLHWIAPHKLFFSLLSRSSR